MPLLLRRLAPARIYVLCMNMWPLAFVLPPALNVLARTGVDPSTGRMTPDVAAMTWVGIGAALLWTRMACVAYSWVSFLHFGTR
jgi:hypothetical protein